MTTFDTGRRAEAAAAAYLQQNGYQVLEQNWRTRYCEIDIVARQDQTIYFVEVKYRANNRHGTGLDYITPKKLQQMGFAAEMWVNNHAWSGAYNLAALEVGGHHFTVTSLTLLD